MVATKTSSGQQAIAGVGVGGTVGASVASAASITLSEFVTEITGSSTITTINGLVTGRIYKLVPGVGSTWRLATGGNIAQPFTPTAGVAVEILMHGTTVRVGSAGAISPPFVTVKDAPYFAVGDDVADDTAAIQDACDDMSALGGGVVMLGTGMFKTTSQILVPKGVVLQGVYSYGRNITYTSPSVIHGVHTGAAVVSLKGAQGCSLRDLEIRGDATTTPKTGLLLGRSAAASAGKHFIQNVLVSGSFTKAAIYSIASEENTWINCTIILEGGGAMYGYYTAQGDNLSVDTLTGSSNIGVWHFGTEILNQVDNAAAACMYLSVGGSTWGHTFNGGYCIGKNGAYVQISVSEDGAACPGPICFFGLSGEIDGSGPSYGYRISASGALALRGLEILGGKLETRAAGNFLADDGNVLLQGCFIDVPTQSHQSSLTLANVSNSMLNLNLDGVGVKRYISNRIVSDGGTGGGIQFGSGNERMRRGGTRLELTDSAAAAFVDLNLKDVYIGGVSRVSTGTGDPEGVITAPVGSLFLRTDGGASTTLYIKESGAGNTGWRAV